MQSQSAETKNSLLLPQQTRVVHIGPPKTGTSALQHTLKALRPKLLESGVYYPGPRVNHRREIFAFNGRADKRWVQMSEAGKASEAAALTPPRTEWKEFLSDIEQHQNHRIIISNEEISSFKDTDIQISYMK